MKKLVYKKRKEIFDLLATAMKYEDPAVIHTQEGAISKLFTEFSQQYDWATADTMNQKCTQNTSFFSKPIVKIFSALIFFSGLGVVLYNFLYGQQLAIA